MTIRRARAAANATAVHAVGFLLMGLALSTHATDAALATPSTHREAIAAGAPRSFRVDVAAGRAIDVALTQDDTAAVSLAWRRGDAADTATLIAEAGRGSTLRTTLVADAPTTWTLSIASERADSTAHATLAVAAMHAATPADLARSDSAAKLAAAETLRRGGDKAKADQARALYKASVDAANLAADACAARRAALASSGFAHDIGDAAAQRSAAQAALDAPCAEGIAERALAERLLGSAYINLGEFAAGTRETERAVAAFEETGDVGQKAIALRNLGLAYAETGEMEKALATTTRASQAAKSVGDFRLLALVHNDLAFMHAARGEFARAADGYRETLDTLRDKPYPMAEAVAWINLGFAYGQLGDGDEAMSAYGRAEAVAASIDCWSCLAETAVDRGDDLVDAGDFVGAQRAYEHALDVAKAHALVRQHAEALRGLGRCAIEAKDWTRARTLLEDARAKLHPTNARVNESVVDVALGDLDNRLGHLDDARRNYDDALKLAREADNTAWQAAALASLARVDAASGHLDAARDAIAEAIALIESERRSISAPELRTSYFGTKRAYYALQIDILMRLDAAHRGDASHDYAGDALALAEHARARELQQQLAERAIDVDAGVDAALIAHERESEDALHALAYQLSQASDDAARSPLRGRIDEASRTLDAARGAIRSANPRYAELMHPSMLSIDEIQHDLIDADVAVAEYWLGDERSYLWIVTRDALHAFVLPPRAAIERDVIALREKLLAPSEADATISIEQRAARDESDLAAANAGAKALADVVLPPAARALLGRDVAVVADGELQALPFAIFDAADGATYRAYDYLPSLATLRGLRALPRSGATPRSLAIVADPVFRADDERLRAHVAAKSDERVASSTDESVPRGPNADLSRLPRLPYTREEAQSIASFGDGNASWLALDFAANRKAALDADWSRYDIAHFATHALVDAKHPELSGIVLSLYGADGRAQDGFVRVSDIYNLHMPASLVVLSVCESALGKSVGAEGAANLARAFFYAGAPHVVASLWPVDDRASVAFMRAFYASLLGRGRNAQQALLDAQAELRGNARWRAPYYWSGYVLQGDWR